MTLKLESSVQSGSDVREGEQEDDGDQDGRLHAQDNPVHR